MKRIFILFSLFFYLLSFSQKIENLPLHKYRLATLSDSLLETSGLTFLKDKLYTFNDGGNLNEFYEISPENGKILKKYKTTFPDIDWEAITNDGENLYIGDFGNNAGKRKDLAVYQVNLQNTEFKKINFEYKDQTDFSPSYLNHDFDAEAMVFLDGKIHVFTKKWASKTVSHYILNVANSEKQTIENTESFNTEFVVTDAAYYQKKLYVVGYTREANVYMMIFEEGENEMFFVKNAIKYNLGSALTIGQVEGIAVNEKGIYISNENFSKFIFHSKQSLYFIPFESLK